MEKLIIIQCAKCLYQSGATSYMIEKSVHSLSQSLHFKAIAFALPKSIWLEFEDQMTSVDCGIQEINLNKISFVQDLISSIDQKSDYKKILQTLNNLSSTDHYLSRKHSSFAFAGLSFGTAVLFNGSIQDCIGALILGIFSAFLLDKLRYSEFSSLSTLILATSLSLFSALFSIFGASPISLLSGIIILVPGFTMTVAFSELASGQLVSGTARLYGALVQFFSLAIGLSVGLYLEIKLPYVLEAIDTPFSVKLSGFMITPFCLSLLFRVPKKDIFLTSVIGLTISILVTNFDSLQAIFLITFLLGLVGTLLPSMTNIKRETIIWPSLLLLVPGTTALQGVRDLFNHNLAKGAENVVQAILCSFLLVIALQLSRVTKRRKNNKYEKDSQNTYMADKVHYEEQI